MNPQTAALRQDTRTIGLVSLAHAVSHFFHLILAPLFPWIRDEFSLSYAQLGVVMSVFFVVSGLGQALAGFVVDRLGARPVLYAGLALMMLAAFGLASSHTYAALMVFSGLAGLGNSVFHPADFSILNARIGKTRLGHAYSVHGLSGSLGWAAAPLFLVGIAQASNWRTAVFCAGLVAAAVLLLVIALRSWLTLEDRGQARLDVRVAASDAGRSAAGAAASKGESQAEGALDFLKLRAVWLAFLFFLFYAVALGGVQSFATEAARQLHDVPVAWAAMCLSIYMVCGAAGILAGGFLVHDPHNAERVISFGFGGAALCALTIGVVPGPAFMVPLLMGVMGFASGVCGPSRDLLVKRAAPPNATGRVYGVVYSGLDVGMAFAPTLFGWMMDHKMPVWVWIAMAFFQAVLVVNALTVGRVSRLKLDAARGSA
ncbi:MAG: MFS transporter [Burkholderiaceae bacterium]